MVCRMWNEMNKCKEKKSSCVWRVLLCWCYFVSGMCLYGRHAFWRGLWWWFVCFFFFFFFLAPFLLNHLSPLKIHSEIASLSTPKHARTIIPNPPGFHVGERERRQREREALKCTSTKQNG